jgi:hypothetical protein
MRPQAAAASPSTLQQYVMHGAWLPLLLTGTCRDYWRNPWYNLTRTGMLATLGFLYGVIFFDIGSNGES